jgi:hypothetical protein
LREIAVSGVTQTNTSADYYGNHTAINATRRVSRGAAVNIVPIDLQKIYRDNPDLAKVNGYPVDGSAKTSVILPVKQVLASPTGPRNKYHVSPREDRTLNGITYASKKEMRKAQELDLMVAAGEIFTCGRCRL